ncbi:MAG TPA: BTAD domain-containing putative transcriptional regulator [Gemmatimonadales bacterium]|nr:BTAD domain-containing putative transcriptional regulator [Gemmatimonadales bacterium]
MLGTVLQLPLPGVGLVGRSEELSTVRAFLKGTRLLTLTGAGGSGKTRLALEAAAQAQADYPDGVGWVELAPLTHPELLTQQVAQVLDIREDGSRPLDEILVRALAARSMLLVLDNCEHLVEAVAGLTTRLLRQCPQLAILATSRQRLHIAGEKSWQVPPLSLPADEAGTDLTRIAQSDAIRLFVERARDVVPTFGLTVANAPVVAEICRRLGGLPLALELAAARLTVLTPEQIRDRLSDAFRLLVGGSRTAIPRHRTLRATVDWSYELLTVPERTLLQRLSSFAGGCTLATVEAVCAGEGLAEPDVLDVLAALVDRSLVVVQEREGAVRYTLLEIVRQHAQQRLGESGCDALRTMRDRHLAHFVALAREGFTHVEQTSSPEWVARLGAEGDNMRGALDWALGDGGQPETALELASLLWLVWFHRAQWSEGHRWLEATLGHPGAQPPGVARARALVGAGVLAYFLRDPDGCRTRFEHADRILRTIGAVRDHPLLLYRYAHLLADLGELDRALFLATEGLALARTLEERWILAELLVFGPAFVHRMRGESDRAEACYAEAEQLGRELGQHMVIVEAGIGRAMLAMQRGDVGSARASVRSASATAKELRAPWYTMRVLLTAAGLAAREGDHVRAVRLLSASAALSAASRAPLFPHEEPFRARLATELEATLGSASFSAETALGAALDPAAELDLLTAPPDAAVEDLPPARPPRTPRRITVRSLGPLQVSVDGVPLSPEAWRYRKARELLLYLLSHPEGRSRDQVGLALWPEASSAQVKNRFNVTAHHLRRVLGGGDCLRLERGRYRIDPAIDLDFDAAHFEREVSAALRAGKIRDLSVDDLQAALERYTEDLLDGEPVGDWHLAARDRLGRLYLEGLTAHAEALLKARQWTEAAEVFGRILQKDELRERTWRQLMVCLARQGEREQALRAYDRLATLLQRELGEDPEPETVALAGRVRRGEYV